MNTRFGQLLSTLIIIGLTLFWSASILADDSAPASANVDAATSSVILASDANETAADRAAAAIAADTKIQLDKLEVEIRIIDQNSLRASAN